MVQRIILLGLIGLVLLSACSANKDTGYTGTAPGQIETIGSNIDQPEESASDIPQISPSEIHEPEQSTAAKEMVETESQKETTQALEIYEGEYTGDTINDPDYDGLEIQKNEEGNINYQELGIQKQEYPAEFSMGENLKTAITQLALSYDHFDQTVVHSESWKEIFIARFIQNSRASFDYLDRISDENDGKISVDQLNYIQYSLTNTEVDFSSEAGDSVNRYDAASSLNYGWISRYSYEETKDGVIVTADFEVGYDGTDSTQKRQIKVELIKNPYSCFDGYSVMTISSETGNSDPEQQN